MVWRKGQSEGGGQEAAGTGTANLPDLAGEGGCGVPDTLITADLVPILKEDPEQMI